MGVAIFIDSTLALADGRLKVDRSRGSSGSAAELERSSAGTLLACPNGVGGLWGGEFRV